MVIYLFIIYLFTCVVFVRFSYVSFTPCLYVYINTFDYVLCARNLGPPREVLSVFLSNKVCF